MKSKREKETVYAFLDIELNIKQERVNGLMVRAINLQLEVATFESNLTMQHELRKLIPFALNTNVATPFFFSLL